MAFKRENFSPVGAFPGDPVSTGFGVYAFMTVDTETDITTAGYFNDLRDVVYADDIVMTSTDIDDTDIDTRVNVITSFLTVPRSPSTANVILKAKNISN